MRLVVLAGLLAILAFVAVRWWTGHRAPITLALVLLLLVPLGLLEWRWQATERTASAVTRQIAPGFDGAACQRMLGTLVHAGGEWGYVSWDATGRADPPVAWLSWEACEALKSYLYSDHRAPTMDELAGLNTVAHEAAHLRGDHGEATAECAAVQDIPHVAAAFGATEVQARLAARLFWQLGYPLQWPEYRTADCREDGPLDRTPGDGTWP